MITPSTIKVHAALASLQARTLHLRSRMNTSCSLLSSIGRNWLNSLSCGSPAVRISATALLSLLLLAGCASYPMGLTREQWEALPSAQQAEYQARQFALNAEHRKLAEERREREAAAEAAQEREERERVRSLYVGGRPGDVVTITVQGGLLSFGGRRLPFEPASFSLTRGEKRNVEFSRLGDPGYKTTVPVELSDDGLRFIFDTFAYNRIVIVDEAGRWQRGTNYRPPEIPVRDGSQAKDLSITIRHRDQPPSSRRWLNEPR